MNRIKRQPSFNNHLFVTYKENLTLNLKSKQQRSLTGSPSHIRLFFTGKFVKTLQFTASQMGFYVMKIWRDCSCNFWHFFLAESITVLSFISPTVPPPPSPSLHFSSVSITDREERPEDARRYDTAATL